MIGADFAEVLTAAQSGAEWAVARLWRELQPPLLRYMTSVDPGAAEDLASDVWLEAAHRLRRFRGGEADFRAFLFTIARHKAIDHQRKQTRRRTSPVAWIPERASSDDPEGEAVESLSTAEALELLAQLPAGQGEAVFLRVVADLDVAEAARVMGRRPGTVRVLAHRGLRTLAGRVAPRVPAPTEAAPLP